MRRAKRSSDPHPELGLPEVRKLWQTEGLFSDHYLKRRIAENDWWPSDAEARPIFEFCNTLYEKRAFALQRYDNEMGVRQEFIDKILGKLGFAWSDNLRLPETQQDLEPDYLLYANEEEKEALLEKNISQRYRGAIGILEAKKFGHPLSQVSRHQQRYPHQQIRDYLNEAQVLTWGILTNGNEWRLYCRDTKPSHFFAINFELAIQSLKNFKFFVALFSPAAFVHDAQNKCRLDYVRESALAAQSQLEEDLRKRVFTLIEILANGFDERAENKIKDSDLPRLYENCLIFLYRLLFILYAEGRSLLPVEPKSRKYYKELSLAHLINPLRDFSEFDSRTRTRLYEDIRELCHLINGTEEKKNAEYKVHQYNGGLFDPNRHPDLEEWRVADAVLADVLRGLVFNPVPERGQAAFPGETVDFGDLRVQQLGSIYEGLMEHHFHREKDSLRLVADKAERRQTGTYYTPDYIVKYIVEETVGSLLAEIDQREDVKAARSTGLKDNSFGNAAIELNILDPAMGSGHFLVDATTHLAEEIASHPTTKPLSEESKDEDEIAYWRRRVVESCIYGVDLNPLAVELAKLSLWLTTIAADRPLDFLDHHLSCGNSLIGARIDQLGALPECKKSRGKSQKLDKQTRFSFGPDFTRVIGETIRQIHSIEEKPSADVDAVKEKEKRWRQKVLPALAPYKAVADLWTSTFFGNALDEETYLAKAQGILAGEKINNPQATARRFFHWELEFPKVFFNDDGKPSEAPGFDAVIGNPPYDADLDSQEKIFINACVNLSDNGRLDTASLFVEQFLRFTAPRRALGYLLPQRLIGRQRDFGPFQRFIYREGGMREVIYLGTVEEFASNDEFVIMTFVNGYKGDFIVAYNVPKERFPHIDSFKKIIRRDLWGPPNYAFNIYLNEFSQDILEKINAHSFKLGDIAESKDGIVVFIRDKLVSETQKDARYRKLLGISGRYFLDRYALDWQPTYICYDINEAKKYITDPVELRKVQLRDERIFTKPEKLLTRQDSITLRGTIDRGQFFHTNSIHTTYLKSGTPYSLNYVLCLINSPILSYYYKTLNLKGQDLHPQILVTNIPKLPIRRIAFTTTSPERKRYLAAAIELYERSLSANEFGRTLEFVDQQLRENRNDVIHDLLAFLADRIMEMNKKKCTTARQFLNDLKDFHGIDVRSMNPKTKMDEFWKVEAADIFAHFRANRVQLRGSDEEKIRERFSKSKSALVPLDSQIAFTDQLIDQIVYRLYGLTPEEIKIVKGEKCT